MFEVILSYRLALPDRKTAPRRFEERLKHVVHLSAKHTRLLVVLVVLRRELFSCAAIFRGKASAQQWAFSGATVQHGSALETTEHAHCFLKWSIYCGRSKSGHWYLLQRRTFSNMLRSKVGGLMREILKSGENSTLFFFCIGSESAELHSEKNK